MSFVNLDMTLRECLEKYPELEKFLYQFIEECVYCAGFRDEPLRKVFEAHKLDPEEVLKAINEFLGRSKR